MTSDKEKKRAIAYQQKRAEEYPGYAIYILPDEHYIGMTKNVYNRIIKHKHKGKNVDGWKVITCFKDPMEAHLYETKLHMMGFNGFRF
jgi:hypothetical protein